MAAASHQADRTERIAVQMEVPRDAAGDLHAGVRTKLDRAAGADVIDVDVTGLQPRLNDLTVEADVRVRLANGAATADLADLVGVHDVTRR